MDSFHNERLMHSLILDSSDVARERMRPCVLFQPEIFPDGNMWCALYGKDLQMGVAGFGESPEKACEDFDRAWRRKG